MRLPLVLAAALAAGCLAPAAPVDPAGLVDDVVAEAWWLGAVPFGDGHDHGDHAHHAGLTTANFDVVGHDPLVTATYGETPTGMGCGGTGATDDGRRLALVHTISTDVAFVVADVTDPAAPRMLGEFYLPNVVVWDATITPDGKHAVVGADLMVFGGGTPVLPGAPLDAAPTLVRTQPMWRDACTGETRAAGPAQYLPVPGVVLVSLEDPTAPRLADWVPQPVIGPHSVTAFDVDGTIVAAASVTNLAHPGSYYSLFEVTSGSRLRPLSVIQAPSSVAPAEPSVPGVVRPLVNGHVDVTIAKHPGTDRWIAWLANWNEGVWAYDVTDLRAPKHLGHWKDGTAGSVHTTYPLPELRDGVHYTIAGQEVGEPRDLPSGWIYILDTTDPANPVEVGRWTLPVKPDWDGGLQFSTHYVEVVGDTMFVANYHGGLWAVDISDPSDPRAVGIFVPDRASPKPYEGKDRQGAVMDVVAAPDGTLTTWDTTGGLYQLRFDAQLPAPKAPAWSG